MVYSKKQIYRITSRLYCELRDNPQYITLRKIKNAQGLYWYDSDLIEIDYRKMLLPTLVHEYLHKWYPDKSETWVLQQEQIIMNALSTRQAKNILKRFSMALCC